MSSRAWSLSLYDNAQQMPFTVPPSVIAHYVATQPLYLVGGFGGCTRAIVNALKGSPPEVLTEEFQTRRDPLYGALAEHCRIEKANNEAASIDYTGELHFMQSKGVEGLNNGLDANENEILFSSKNLAEIVFLILSGLARRLA